MKKLIGLILSVSILVSGCSQAVEQTQDGVLDRGAISYYRTESQIQKRDQYLANIEESKSLEADAIADFTAIFGEEPDSIEHTSGYWVTGMTDRGFPLLHYKGYIFIYQNYYDFIGKFMLRKHPTKGYFNYPLPEQYDFSSYAEFGRVLSCINMGKK